MLENTFYVVEVHRRGVSLAFFDKSLPRKIYRSFTKPVARKLEQWHFGAKPAALWQVETQPALRKAVSQFLYGRNFSGPAYHICFQGQMVPPASFWPIFFLFFKTTSALTDL